MGFNDANECANCAHAEYDGKGPCCDAGFSPDFIEPCSDSFTFDAGWVCSGCDFVEKKPLKRNAKQ